MTQKVTEFLLSLVSNPADLIMKPDRAGKTGRMGGLYLGSLAALSPRFLIENDIVAVISMLPKTCLPALPPSVKYHYCCPVQDRAYDSKKLGKLLPHILPIIHRSREQGNVLVHCRAGMQRAPTVCVRYLIRYYGAEPEGAYQKIRSTRPLAFSNGVTFQKLLK